MSGKLCIYHDMMWNVRENDVLTGDWTPGFVMVENYGNILFTKEQGTIVLGFSLEELEEIVAFAKKELEKENDETDS